MGVNKEPQNTNHNFNIIETIKAPEEVVNHIKMGLAKTWDMYVGSPRSFNVNIASFLTHPVTGEKLEMLSQYDPQSDTFLFALDTTRKQLTGPIELLALVLSAHEAFHAVQIHNDDPPTPSFNNENYNNDRHEEEAWNAAKEVCRSIYPEIQGQITRNGKTLISFD